MQRTDQNLEVVVTAFVKDSFYENQGQKQSYVDVLQNRCSEREALLKRGSNTGVFL